MTSAGGAQVTVDGKNGSSGALSVLSLFLCSSRLHWLRLECVEGLLHSRVWDLAQVAGRQILLKFKEQQQKKEQIIPTYTNSFRIKRGNVAT